MQRELFWLGIKSRIKNNSDIEQKIHFRRNFLLTTQFTYKKQLQAVLTKEDEIRTCRYFMLVTQFTCKKQLQAVLTEEDEIRTCSYLI